MTLLQKISLCQEAIVKYMDTLDLVYMQRLFFIKYEKNHGHLGRKDEFSCSQLCVHEERCVHGFSLRIRSREKDQWKKVCNAVTQSLTSVLTHINFNKHSALLFNARLQKKKINTLFLSSIELLLHFSLFSDSVMMQGVVASF